MYAIRSYYGIILGEAGEDVDRVRRLVHLGEDQTFEKASLGILRAAAQVGVDFFERLRVLPLV